MPPISPARPVDRDDDQRGESAPEDGYGALLRDAYAAGPRRGAHLQIIERDDGFVSIEDAYRYFTRPDEWIAGERRAVALASGRALDVGCGAGRHMLALTGDREVIGIDPSPGAVAVARAQGLDARIGTATDPGDLGTFDTLLMLGGNLGLLGSREHAPVVLDSLARLARPGARLLAIGHDPHEASAPEHCAYHDRNADRGRLPGQVRMRVRYKTWTSDWFDRLLLSPDELRTLLAGSAWTLREATYSPNTAGFYLAEMTRAETPATAPATC
ncbi:class I SAM-dependent methyltransferase [Actinomadura sp. KC216]|uniref:class I SAM-dependent methyltransferase n=1 Tax=Actinomadura sp. KC216 TaxID=2530370 RepID=UPI00104FCE2B|nr:class I SAM-dependent methyltransferase [Actinomadura sp. KC216]TDB88371.1 class I SAM-dependent methyltransferase [Actinomadura sp. KC216]